MARKPAWVIDKERAESASIWLFGLHAVRDALQNPARRKLRLVLTKNAGGLALFLMAGVAVYRNLLKRRKWPIILLLLALAVIAPLRHSAPESGALAKTASGALERQPYLRVKNLSVAMEELKGLGFQLIGLAGEVDETIEGSLKTAGDRVGLVLGAEGPGLRDKTRATCDRLARIPFARDFGSLNVSNAAAVSLYAVAQMESG